MSNDKAGKANPNNGTNPNPIVYSRDALLVLRASPLSKVCPDSLLRDELADVRCNNQPAAPAESAPTPRYCIPRTR